MTTVQVFADCSGGCALLLFMPPQDTGDAGRTFSGHIMYVCMLLHYAQSSLLLVYSREWGELSVVIANLR